VAGPPAAGTPTAQNRMMANHIPQLHAFFDMCQVLSISLNQFFQNERVCQLITFSIHLFPLTPSLCRRRLCHNEENLVFVILNPSPVILSGAKNLLVRSG